MKSILQIILIAIIVAIAVTAPASAEIPTSTLRHLQDKAPEKLVIEVQSVKKRNQLLIFNYHVVAKVISIKDSATGLKVGDSIKIRYSLHHPTRAVTAGSYPIEVKKGATYNAYLKLDRPKNKKSSKKKGNTYFPDAEIGSFDQVVAKISESSKKVIKAHK